MKDLRKFRVNLSTIRGALASRWFWYVVVGIFLFNTLWIALMGAYPLVYDEAYHIGIIDVYSHQWLPFVQSQAENTASLGDITRYGSYLYHYLMSFPYRIFMGVGLDQPTTIILLRIINVGIFVSVMYWMRNLLRAIGFSRPITQLSVFIVTLLPIFPYLGATVNYDSLFLLSTAIFLTLVVRFLKSKTPSSMDLIILIIIGCLSSVTKYTFLPIFAISSVVIVISLIRRREYFTKLVRSSANPVKVRPSWKMIGTCMLLVVSIGLFVERYGTNIVAYHQPEPSCTTIHSVDFCRQWGPWGNSYKQQQANINPEEKSLEGFVNFVSLYWMRDIINNTSLMGGINSLTVASYWSLRIIHAGAALILLLYVAGLFHRKFKGMLWLHLVFIFYVGILVVRNYDSYIRAGIPIAIQTRYLLWFLPIIAACALYSMVVFMRAMEQYNARNVVVIGLISIICSSQFAGNMTYWYRQNQTWVSEEGTSQQLNSAMHRLAEKIIVEQPTLK